MASDIRSIQLGDLGAIVTGSTPPAAHPEYFGSDTPFLTPSDFTGARTAGKTGRSLSRAGLIALSSRLVPRGVAVSCIGSQMGRAVLIDSPTITNQQINTVVVDPSLANSTYVYYVLSAREAEIRQLGAGASAVPLLNKRDFSRIEIQLPSRAEQDRIAHILGTLDDKIELNRRMNATLEEMARALFKSWFVDFDPVRAKADGRDPGIPPHLADLFPARLVDSALGPIPEGWVAGRFGDFVIRRSQRVGNRGAVVLSAVATGELVSSEEHFKKRVHSVDISNYLLVEQGDFAFNPSRINIGSIGMLQQPVVGAVSPVYIVARPDNGYRWFLEFNLRLPATRSRIAGLASGSVRQSLSYTDFASLPSVVPPQPAVQAFAAEWHGLSARIEQATREAHVLSQCRDLLVRRFFAERGDSDILETRSGSARESEA